MPSFLCDYMNEIVVLADGRVTTCCLDPLGMNVFGDIIKDRFEDIEKRYIHIRERVTREVTSQPKCSICYRKIRDDGFKPTGTYKVNPTDVEIEKWLSQAQCKIKQMVIELTIQCNLQCNGCMQSRIDFTKHRNSAFMDTDVLMRWLRDALVGIQRIRLYNYGETFLHPRAIDLINWIKESNRETIVSVATNGMLLTSEKRQQKLVESGVDELFFSIHGSNQASIEKYMGTGFNFSQIIKTIKNIQTLKRASGVSAPRIIWKYLLFEWNDTDEEIEKAEKLARELKLDPVLFDIPGYPAPTKRFRKDSRCANGIRKI